jgi:hypothetical protein
MPLTPEEFELHLTDLRDRLRAHLERGEGSYSDLRAEAEKVLSLAGEHPEEYARHPEVEGLVADLLARGRQKEFMAWGAPEEAPGCLLGWLFGGRRDHR